MKIDNIYYQPSYKDGTLTDKIVIETPHGTKKEIIEFLSTLELKKGKEYSINIKPRQNARTLTQNGYLWAIIGEIVEYATAYNIEDLPNTPREIYRHILIEAGIFTVICVEDENKFGIIDRWEDFGSGWIAEDMGKSKIKGCSVLRLYKGSSEMTTKQMAHVIAVAEAVAKEYGVNL